MATKVAILLMVVGACIAFPSEEQPRPQQLPVNAPGPSESLEPSQAPSEVPPHKEGKEEDLKTENTFWWGRSYYPVYYRPRSYVVYPRSYYYTPYWSTWW